MTNLEYLKVQLSKFGVTDAELEAALIAAGVDPNADLTPESAKQADAAIYDFIPRMLAGLQNTTEGDYSVSWNFEGVKLWYSALASKLGKPDLLNPQPSITDASNRW